MIFYRLFTRTVNKFFSFRYVSVRFVYVLYLKMGEIEESRV